MGLSAGIGSSGQAQVCIDAGVKRVVFVDDAVEVEQVTDTFACAKPIAGSIGDPSDPPYVPYRIAIEEYPGPYVRVCVGSGTVSRSVAVSVGTDPDVGVSERASSAGPLCDGGPYQTVGAGGQAVSVGVGTDENGFVYCIGTEGGLVTCMVRRVFDVLTSAECPAVPYALALVDQALDDVVEAVEDAPGVVLDAVDDVLGIVNPLLQQALDEAAEAREVAEGVVEMLPVELDSTLGACSVSVAAVGSVQVTRSPTGQVPASVCVSDGSTVVRITIG